MFKKLFWNPVFGDMLTARAELGNAQNPYAVAVVTRG